MKLLRFLGNLLLPVAFCLCLFLALHTAAHLKDMPNVYSLYMDGAGKTAKEAEAMQVREKEEKHPLAFGIWGQQQGVSLTNPGLNHTASADLITICGSSGLLYPDAPLLLPGDRTGCLIDRATAQALFGTKAAIGGTVNNDGKQYIVRGIIESDFPVVLIQSLSQDDAVLNRITLQIPAGESAKTVLGDFQNRHGATGHWLPLKFWAQAADSFALLAPVLGLLLLIGAAVKTALGLTARPVPFILALLLAGVFWGLFLWLTGASFAVPQDWIPGKWSDFDFWSGLWETKTQELLMQFTTPKSAAELGVFQQSLTSCLFGVLALILLPVSLPRLKPKSLRTLWGFCALFCAGVFFAVYLLQSSALADSALAWWFPSVYLAGAYLNRRFKQWTEKIDEAVPAKKALPAGTSLPKQLGGPRHYRLRDGKL